MSLSKVIITFIPNDNFIKIPQINNTEKLIVRKNGYSLKLSPNVSLIFNFSNVREYANYIQMHKNITEEIITAEFSPIQPIFDFSYSLDVFTTRGNFIKNKTVTVYAISSRDFFMGIKVLDFFQIAYRFQRTAYVNNNNKYIY